MSEPSPFGAFPRYALGVISPLAGTDTMPYGLYRLLGPEREFGKPVITHLNGTVRGILQALDCWRPFPAGHGRVLETP